MPIIKSAIKRVNQTHKRTALNLRTKRRLKETLKAVDSAIASTDQKKMPELMSSLYSAVDTAQKKNLIHKNKAARIKSRYAQLVKNSKSKPVKTRKAPPKKTKK